MGKVGPAAICSSKPPGQWLWGKGGPPCAEGGSTLCRRRVLGVRTGPRADWFDTLPISGFITGRPLTLWP